MPIERRDFIKSTTAAITVGAAALALKPHSVLGANDRVRVAVCGTRGRGVDHIHGFNKLPNVEIAALFHEPARCCCRPASTGRSWARRRRTGSGSDTAATIWRPRWRPCAGIFEELRRSLSAESGKSGNQNAGTVA